MHKTYDNWFFFMLSSFFFPLWLLFDKIDTEKRYGMTKAVNRKRKKNTRTKLYLVLVFAQNKIHIEEMYENIQVYDSSYSYNIIK